jgi:hypothetical protein
MTSTMRFDKWENTLGQPYGTVLQVVSVTKTDTFTMSGTTFTTVTGLSATITPRFANSTILVTASVNVSQDMDVNNGFVQLVRGTTPIGVGDTAGSRRRAGFPVNARNDSYPIIGNLMVVDSPASTSAQTYSVQVSGHQGGGTMFVNRSDSDPDNGFSGRYSSTITLMEIAQ